MTIAGNESVGAGIGVQEAARNAARLPVPSGQGAMLFAAGKMEAAKLFYEAMLTADPESREAHAGLYRAYSALGDSNRAASHLGRAMHWPAIVKLPFHGKGEPVPVLLLLSFNAGNVLIQRFLNDRIFQTYVMFVESHGPKDSLPGPSPASERHWRCRRSWRSTPCGGRRAGAIRGAGHQSSGSGFGNGTLRERATAAPDSRRGDPADCLVPARTTDARGRRPATACAGLRVSLAGSRPRFPHGKKLCSRGSRRRS